MIILYLYENTIQVKEKDIIKEFALSPEAMMYGKVRNSNLFEQQLHKIVVQEKWITFFKTKKVLLIVPANYEAIDKEIITVILNNLGITNIKYQEETTLYDIKPNQLFLNVNESYLLCTRITHKKKKTQFYPYYVLGNLSTTIEWIIKCNKKKKIYLFGSYENIPKLVKNYNFQTIFYYNNYKNFIISKIP